MNELVSWRETPKDSTHKYTHTFAGKPGFFWDDLRAVSIKKVPHRNGFGTSEDCSGLT